MPLSSDTPRLYGELASWFHLLTNPQDYAEEAEFARGTLCGAGSTPLRTVLELGSGGGNNASHLKAHFQMTLVDLSEPMLELSQSLNPECEHICGDMRSVRLDRAFDAVFVHDAIMYMTTETDLRAAVETAFVHCSPGGVALFMPDVIRENFSTLTTHGGHDGHGRSIRYIEWRLDMDPSDSTYTVDFAYLLCEGSRPVRVIHDRHVFGIFSRDVWLNVLHEAGFVDIRAVPDAWSREVFAAVKPNADSRI